MSDKLLVRKRYQLGLTQWLGTNTFQNRKVDISLAIWSTDQSNAMRFHESIKNLIDLPQRGEDEDGNYEIDLWAVWHEEVNDEVNKPAHYTDGKIEVIDFIEDKKLGFHLGNTVKYVARAGKKDPTKTIQDLEKAKWYLEREINRLKSEQ